VARQERVERPQRKAEYEIRYGSRDAQKGWLDLVATQRGPMVDTWEFLTATPTAVTPTNYTLRGELATIVRDGRSHQRWQHKPTSGGTARVWFYVDETARVVWLEHVHTSHPNQTK